MQATQGCGKYNVYVGKGMKDRKIDVCCKHCGRRVKFQWNRWENRGRPRPVSVVDRPESMTRAALVSEMQAKNAGFMDGVIPDTHLLSTEFSSVKVKAKPKLSPEALKMKEEYLAEARKKMEEKI